MSIYTNWDPLTEVIVGNCPTVAVRGNLARILQETKEDLDVLAEYLIKLGVQVHRPRITKFPENINVGHFTIDYHTASIVPRDQYLVYGNTIYQTYTSMPDRYLDSQNYNHISRFHILLESQ